MKYQSSLYKKYNFIFIILEKESVVQLVWASSNRRGGREGESCTDGPARFYH